MEIDDAPEKLGKPHRIIESPMSINFLCGKCVVDETNAAISSRPNVCVGVGCRCKNVITGEVRLNKQKCKTSFGRVWLQC